MAKASLVTLLLAFFAFNAHASPIDLKNLSIEDIGHVSRDDEGTTEVYLSEAGKAKVGAHLLGAINSAASAQAVDPASASEVESYMLESAEQFRRSEAAVHGVADGAEALTAERRELGNFDVLNRYWLLTTYGKQPGPCPNTNDRCSGKACNLQDWIKEIVVIGGMKIDDLLITDSCGTYPGIGEIYELTCNNLFLDNVALITTVLNSYSVEMKINVDRINLNCAGKFEGFNVGLKPFDPVFEATILGTGEKLYNPVYYVQMPNFAINKEGVGITLRATTTFFTKTQSDTLDENLPFFMMFTGADQGCIFTEFEFGLEFLDDLEFDYRGCTCVIGFCCGSPSRKTFGDDFIEDFILTIADFILGFVDGLIKGLLAGILCGVVRGLALVEDGGQPSDTDPPPIATGCTPLKDPPLTGDIIETRVFDIRLIDGVEQGRCYQRGGINLVLEDIHDALEKYYSKLVTVKYRGIGPGDQLNGDWWFEENNMIQFSGTTNKPFPFPPGVFDICKTGEATECAEAQADVGFPLKCFDSGDGYECVSAADKPKYEAIDLTGAVDFSTSNIFESISVGINRILGSESDTLGYEGVLVMNEMADVALGVYRCTSGQCVSWIGTPLYLQTCTITSNCDSPGLICSAGKCVMKGVTCSPEYQAGVTNPNNNPCSGIWNIGDVRAQFELDNYPRISWGIPYKLYVNGKVPPPVFNGYLELKNLRIEGLNTFRYLRILDNGYAEPTSYPGGAFGVQFKHSTVNDIFLEKFAMDADLEMFLSDGEWVTSRGYVSPSYDNGEIVFEAVCGKDFTFNVVDQKYDCVGGTVYRGVCSIPASGTLCPGGRWIGTIKIGFSVSLALDEITFNSTVTTAFISDDLLALQIGSLFGGHIEKQLDRLRCLGTAFQWIEILSMRPKLEAIGEISTSNFFGTFDTLVEDGVEVFEALYRSALNKYLPSITEWYVRPRINDYFWEKMFSDNSQRFCAIGEHRCVSGLCRFYTSLDKNDPLYQQPCGSDDDCPGGDVCSGSGYCYIEFRACSGGWDPILTTPWNNPCGKNKNLPVVVKQTPDYADFFDSRGFALIENLINEVIGGPEVIKTSSGDINRIVEVYLDYYLPNLRPNYTIDKIEYGLYRVYDPPIINVNQGFGKRFKIDDTYFINTNSIHQLYIEATDTYKFAVRTKIGDGKVFDPTIQKYEERGPIGLRTRLDGNLLLTRGATGSGLPENTWYADDVAYLEFTFSNLTIDTEVEAWVNQNDIQLLRFQDLLEPTCLLSILDYVYMEDITIGFETFNVIIDNAADGSGADTMNDHTGEPGAVYPRPYGAIKSGGIVDDSDAKTSLFKASTVNILVSGSDTHPGTGTNLAKALELLQFELPVKPVVRAMLEYIFDGVERDIMEAINTYPVNDPVEGCAERVLEGGDAFEAVLGFIFDTSNFSDFYNSLSVDQQNPRGEFVKLPNYPALTAAEIEADVVFDPEEDDFFDIGASTLIQQVSDVFETDGVAIYADALRQLATIDITESLDALSPVARAFADGLVVENDDSVTLDADLRGVFQPIYNSSNYIPGLFIELSRVRINNVEAMESVEFLKPYPDARFTMQHTLDWLDNQDLEILVNVTIEVDEAFVSTEVTELGQGLVEDFLEFTLTLDNLRVELMTLTALNITRLNELPLGNLVDFEDTDCFFSIFFQNGLSLPQLWVTFENLLGPSLRVSGNFLSPGVTAFIEAIAEILVQLVRDDIPDAFQGDIREKINEDYLGRWVNDAYIAWYCGPFPLFAPDPYVDFNAKYFDAVELAVSDLIGGKPVSNAAVSINELAEIGLVAAYDAAVEDERNNLGELNIDHPEKGTWTLIEFLDFDTGSDQIRVWNVSIANLDTIHELTMDVVDDPTDDPDPLVSRTLDIRAIVGDGKLYDARADEYIELDPLEASAWLDLAVVKDSTGDVLANDRLKFSFRFSNITVDSEVFALINRNDLYSLRVAEMTKPRCVLAVVDDLNLNEFFIGFEIFQIDIEPDLAFGTPSALKLATALELLIGTAPLYNTGELSNDWTTDTPIIGMLSFIFTGLSDAIQDAVNSFSGWNGDLATCTIPTITLAILSGVETAGHQAEVQAALEALPGVIDVVVDLEFYTVELDQTDACTEAPFVTRSRGTVTVRAPGADYYAGDIPGAEQAAFIQSMKDAVAPIRQDEDPAITIKLGSQSPCAQFDLPGGAAAACDWYLSNDGNITAKFEQWTTDRGSPLDEGETAAFLEKDVVLNFLTDTYYDVQTSAIVDSVSSYFSGNPNKIKSLLRDTVNQTTFLAFADDDTVMFQYNITDALMFIDGFTDVSWLLVENNQFIPRLRWVPGMLTITNLDGFSNFDLLVPYPDAKFMTYHQIGWVGTKMTVTFDMVLIMDRHFVDPNTPLDTELIYETLTINMDIQDLLIQAITLLAVDLEALGELSLGDFLQVRSFPDQIFSRNCQAVSCLLTSIYDGGMSFPQLRVNVTEIDGPNFNSETNLFLSPGASAMIDAVMEIVVQLFKDDLPNIMQGPVRETANEFFTTTLANAKLPGACPPQRNYVGRFPLGGCFCSHKQTASCVNPKTNALQNFVEIDIQDDCTCQGISDELQDDPGACAAKKATGFGSTDVCEWVVDAENQGSCQYRLDVLDLDFAKNEQLVRLNEYIRDEVLNPDSPVNINTILKNLVGGIETGVTSVTDFPLRYGGISYGDMSYALGPLRVPVSDGPNDLGCTAATGCGFDSVHKLVVFDNTPFKSGGEAAWPQEDDDRFTAADNVYMSRTEVGLAVEKPILITVDTFFEFDGLFGDKVVRNELQFGVELEDVDIIADLFMLVNIPRLMDLQVQSISTLYQLPCILAIFEPNGLTPTHFNVTYQSVDFQVRCTGICNSPLLEFLQGSDVDGDSSETLSQDFTKSFNSLTNTLIALVASTEAQGAINEQIERAQEACAAILLGVEVPTVTEAPEVDVATFMGIAGLGAVFVTMCSFAFLVPVHYRRRDNQMKAALLATVNKAQGKSKDEFELAERKLKSLFEHPSIPYRIKFLIPTMILANVVLFITANFLSVGATVELKLGIAGDTTRPLALLPFTLESSINDMWAAGTWPLAIIIAVASGGWPYAKNILLFFTWMAPATVLSTKRRGHWLEVLDILGKWSLIDAYVLIMLQVAFRFYLNNSMAEFDTVLPAGFLVLDVAVRPGWGMYGFLIAAMGSLIANQIAIWWHQKAEQADEELEDAINGTLVQDLRTPRIALWKHRFNVTNQKGQSYRYTVASRVAVVATMALSGLLIVAGSFIPLMSFEFKGVAGLAIAFIGAELKTATYSLITIGTSIIEIGADSLGAIMGIVFLQIVYIMFAFVVPLITLGILAALWAVPLTLKEQKIVYFVAQISAAWEALMVLVVSVVACILQISQLAQFIVAESTGSLCTALEAPLQTFLADESDAKCFDVFAKLEPTGFVVIAGGVMAILSMGVAWRLIKAALTDRDLAMKRKTPVSPGEMKGLRGFLVRSALEPFGGVVTHNNALAQMQGGPGGNPYTDVGSPFQAKQDPEMENPYLSPAPAAGAELDNPYAQQPMAAANPMFGGGGPGIDV